MGKALYRLYRSKSFDELVGQEHITSTLISSVKTGKIVHAYLFTGPRGVGKTSVARIFAHQVNNIEYGDSAGLIDIIEIDAASNRRIDEIRELRDKVQIAPVNLKYKVYIIDEVHMLTKEAFNALLKTLEEPPSHVIFILATTEFHKLPETIVSRCVHFSFRPLSIPETIKQLNMIAKNEKINIESEAIELIAVHGGGSFRDSISFLDQIRHIEGVIKIKDVEEALGLAPVESLKRIISSISEKDTASVIKNVNALLLQGLSPEGIAQQISAEYRELLVKSLVNQSIIKLLRQLLKVSASSDARMELELALVEASLDSRNLPFENAENNNSGLPSKTELGKKLAQTRNPDETKKGNLSDENQSDPTILWPRVLDALKEKNRTLYGISRMAEVRVEGNVLLLDFNFAFHYRQMDSQKNKQLLRKIIDPHSASIDTITVRHIPKSRISKESTSDDLSTINSVTNIFGTSEVLES